MNACDRINSIIDIVIFNDKNSLNIFIQVWMCCMNSKIKFLQYPSGPNTATVNGRIVNPGLDWIDRNIKLLQT